jgi:ATP-dependent exoDNAse (exonuclease V) alpha subunit
VVGCALAARAARELQAGSGIEAGTIDRLLADLARPGHTLPAGGVLVVDEAGMVGTRTLARLLDAAQRSGTKLVLVGDHHQLPEIDAGGAFAGLAARLPRSSWSTTAGNSTAGRSTRSISSATAT